MKTIKLTISSLFLMLWLSSCDEDLASETEGLEEYYIKPYEVSLQDTVNIESTNSLYVICLFTHGCAKLKRHSLSYLEESNLLNVELIGERVSLNMGNARCTDDITYDTIWYDFKPKSVGEYRINFNNNRIIKSFIVK